MAGRRCSFASVILALACACGGPALGDDEIGDETSAGETSTSETSTDEGSSDEGTTGSPDCGGFSFVPSDPIPPNWMLVVDASSSMALETWDHDGDPLTAEVTRWSSARMLIELLVAEFGPVANLGVQRFPAAAACPDATCTDDDVCLLAAAPEVTLGLDQGPVILATLPTADADAIEIVGGSPASAAVVAAREHLLDSQPRWAPKGIVLITDGGANCGEGLSLPESFEIYDELLAENVSKSFQFDQIPTLVVGVDIGMTVGVAGEDSPQVDPFTALNEVALAGGMPWQQGMEAQKFYDVRDSADIIEAMQPLEGSTDCTLDLTTFPEPPPDPNESVNIEMDGVPVPYVEDCAIEVGWTWISEPEILAFCGSWCDLWKDGAVVEGEYVCAP
jgi:hypothetical protein